MAAPSERFAYVSLIDPTLKERPDAIGVLDLDASSPTYGKLVHTVEMPEPGDELHHFGWNACSSALCPSSPHPHVERRYLIVPGLRSSNIHILDTKPDPRAPSLVRTISRDELVERTGYSRPHTSHCGPDGIYMSGLGGSNGAGEAGGLFLLDCDSLDPLGAWEVDKGPQRFAYDFWWHLGHDTLLTSEWGTPDMFENGVVPEKLLGREYGHAMHVWDMRRRKHVKTLDLGDAHQMVLELRPAHDPRRAYGFVGVVTSVEDLSASIWLWEGDGRDDWRIEKVITIPAEPADPAKLPPLLQGFGAVPPLVTDINLSLDDRFLYVSCWGTGDFYQYDVSDPHDPKQTAKVRIGGLVDAGSHPAAGVLGGGPQMVEVSRDGRRVYVSNSLYSSWDEQFYPEGFDGWVVKLDADPAGGMTLDAGFLCSDLDGRRPHQIRLDGGDASSDSFCFP
jgi:selenium-binding protein 1